MKKLAAILCLTALATGAFAQGTVNFLNTAGTLISYDGAATPTAVRGFYYALLTAPAGSTALADFSVAQLTGTRTGPVYGTNQTVAGRFTGGASLPIEGWAPGATRAFVVAGWSSALGTAFDTAWLTAANRISFGFSEIGAGIAGGGPQSLPNLAIFGATPAISQGFNILVPEPTSMALAGLGAAALLIFRRRK